MPDFYTPDAKLMAHPKFAQIKSCLDRLCASDTVSRLPGNCISACDILQNMLTFYEIPSRIIECQAMFIKENQEIKDFLFVGFNNVNVDHGTVDSHVVIVTDTEPPVLIDAACGHLMPKNQQIICRVLDNVNPTVIATFEIDDITVTYHHKKIIRLPGLHQKTLIDRMREEQDTKHRIRFLTRMLWMLFAIAMYNFLANNALLILKMIYP